MKRCKKSPDTHFAANMSNCFSAVEVVGTEEGYISFEEYLAEKGLDPLEMTDEEMSNEYREYIKK